MTERQIRKYIRPFLEYCIAEFKRNKEAGDWCEGFCIMVNSFIYSEPCKLCLDIYQRAEIRCYIKDRLKAVKPKDARPDLYDDYWWPIDKIWGIDKRIAFCNLQLKIVKP